MTVGVTGEVTAHRILLDRQDLGPADRAPPLIAGPGRHLLRLVDLDGTIVDQVRFTIR
jgi:penicillin-binding protein 1C